MTTDTPNLDLKALLLDEFVKKPKAEKKKKSTAKGDSPQKTIQELRLQAEEDAERLLQTYWRAVARVYHIADHFCDNCGQTQSVVTATLIRHRNAQGALWERHRENPPEDLPEVIVSERHRVRECALCLTDRVYAREDRTPVTGVKIVNPPEDMTEDFDNQNLRELADDIPNLPLNR